MQIRLHTEIDETKQSIRESLSKRKTDLPCLDKAFESRVDVEEPERFQLNYLSSYFQLQLDRIRRIGSAHKSIRRVYLNAPSFYIEMFWPVLSKNTTGLISAPVECEPGCPKAALSGNSYITRASLLLFDQRGKKNGDVELITLFAAFNAFHLLEHQFDVQRAERLKENRASGESIWDFLWQSGGIIFYPTYEQYVGIMKDNGEPPVAKYVFQERMNVSVEKAREAPKIIPRWGVNWNWSGWGFGTWRRHGYPFSGW